MVINRDNSSSNENSKETKQQWLYSQIKTAIINNEYLPGTMLTERALCDKYDVSRTPIREALRQLANEGMVQHIIGKGAFVADVSFELSFEELLSLFIAIANLHLAKYFSSCLNPLDIHAVFHWFFYM
jgi:DNA-binding GntR family transcriptional regulator